MVRKGHRKSRAGCNECKRRHIKCDEQKPRCRRCIASQRECDFFVATIETTRSVSTQPPIQTVRFPETPSAQTESFSAPERIESVSSPPVPEITSKVNVDHLKLLYNYEHATCKTVARTSEEIEIFQQLTIHRAFERPFLLQAILALSALHLSLQRHSHSSTYLETAALMQSQALHEFHLISPHMINEGNVLDIVLFQHIIGLHVFCDVFASVNDDFNMFLDRLVGCIRLLRGMRSVTEPWWDFLSQTEIGPIMLSSHTYQEQTAHPSKGECEGLQSLIAEADLRSESISICQSSVSRLQSYIDAENSLDEASCKSTNMLFAWLMTLSSEFVDILDQRRPEALIILAHYAPILYNRRHSWAVSGAGKHLLRHINGHLGKRWEHWLEWPNSVVLQNTNTTNTPHEAITQNVYITSDARNIEGVSVISSCR